MVLCCLPRAVVPRAIVFVSTFLASYYVYCFQFTTDRASSHSVPLSTNDDARCKAHPDPGNIVAALKTNASEATFDLVDRATTNWYCLDPARLLLFSDLDHEVGVWHLEDILQRVDPSLRESHSDFEPYRQQHEYAARGHDIRDLSKTPVLRADGPTQKEQAGNKLDKYKYLHMIERAWELQPGQDWYVFGNIDTYFVWSNLVQWLAGFDPAKPYFFGRIYARDHGVDVASMNSGVILSGTAIRELMSGDSMFASPRGFAQSWDKRIPKHVSGDNALAAMMDAEINLKVTDMWPLLNGQQPPLLPTLQDTWCEPIISMTSVSSSASAAIWAMEHATFANTSKATVTYGDIFETFSETHNFTVQDYWDNMGDDPNYALERVPPRRHPYPNEPAGKQAVLDENFDPNRSMAACGEACLKYDKCVQFSFLTFQAVELKTSKQTKLGGVCHLSKAFRVGRAREMYSWDDVDDAVSKGVPATRNTHVWSSGWIKERIDTLKAKVVC